MLGRFGWQATTISVRDQTSKAFALEMGITSSDRPDDDCTVSEAQCMRRRATGIEVSDEQLAAVTAYTRSLAVPPPADQDTDSSGGATLFASIGCAACHRPQVPVELPVHDDQAVSSVIAPYSDLLLHDLGNDMADEDVSGARVPTRWRTAPLWGLGYQLRTQQDPTFLHDGRARSIEEAILWHGGEAATARRRFTELGPRARTMLVHWLETR